MFQGTSNIMATVAQATQLADAANRAAADARTVAMQAAASPAQQPPQPPRNQPQQDQDNNMRGALPPLRKMETKPPLFDGDIDGIKLNNFVIQFESDFRHGGYDLALHDDQIGEEMSQCVRKNALVWYERFMTDERTQSRGVR